MVFARSALRSLCLPKKIKIDKVLHIRNARTTDVVREKKDFKALRGCLPYL